MVWRRSYCTELVPDVLCYVTYNARKKNVCAIGTIDTTYMYDTTNSTTQ